MARTKDNLPGPQVEIIDGNVNEKLARFINLFQPAAKRLKDKTRVTVSFAHEFELNEFQTTTSLENTFTTTFIAPSFLEDSFEYSSWPDTIPDSLINPDLDFGAAETSLSDGFENSDGWPDT